LFAGLVAVARSTNATYSSTGGSCANVCVNIDSTTPSVLEPTSGQAAAPVIVECTVPLSP
jgi:hypothetical protein